MSARVLDCPDEAATARVGHRLGLALAPGLVLHLSGELGAGKTTLVRALLRARAPGLRVKSPTYTLVEGYALPELSVAHLDLYRVADPAELEALALRELIADGAALLVEWPEHGAGQLPPADLAIRIEPAGRGRRLRLQPATARGEAWLRAIDGPTSSESG